MSLIKRRKIKPLRRCIILDLDETFVHTSEQYDKYLTLNPFTDPQMLKMQDRFYTIYLDNYQETPSMWGVIRPYTKEFIEFCFRYFDLVCVWSAGSERYVHEIVKIIFPPHMQPHVVYSRDNCSYTQNNVFFKPISSMIENEGLHEFMRHSNTFFVDDRDLNFLENPENGILIPPYEPPCCVDTISNDEDVALLELMQWFMRADVARTRDIKLLEKDRIFTANI